MALGGGRAQGSVHMFFICYWWEQGVEGAEKGGAEGAGEAGTGGERASCSSCSWEVWLQGGVEGESARRRGGTWGRWCRGRREQVVTCLSAQLFCVQEQRETEAAGRRESNPARGPVGPSALATGPETKATPPESDSWGHNLTRTHSERFLWAPYASFCYANTLAMPSLPAFLSGYYWVSSPTGSLLAATHTSIAGLVCSHL